MGARTGVGVVEEILGDQTKRRSVCRSTFPNLFPHKPSRYLFTEYALTSAGVSVFSTRASVSDPPDSADAGSALFRSSLAMKEPRGEDGYDRCTRMSIKVEELTL